MSGDKLQINAEFESNDLGDARLDRRLLSIVDALTRHPEASFPAALGSTAEVEAFYRLLRNEQLTYKKVTQSHRDTTAARCAEFKEVLVIHDWTEFNWSCNDDYLRENLSRLSKQRQGFYGHCSIACSADGLRVPLGTIGMKTYVHKKQSTEKCQEFWNKISPACESEGEHWMEGIKAAEKSIGDKTAVIHVCDREADKLRIFRGLRDGSHRYVIRLTNRKHRTMNKLAIVDLLEKQPFIGKRVVNLSPRSLQGVPQRSRTQPERVRRSALMSFRAVAVSLNVDDKPFDVNVVEAIERKPPSGDKPVRWLLITSEPASTMKQVLRVVDIYRSRWLVEEYFKAIKTGCAYRKRQLDSASTLLIALALCEPIAWRLLALRHLDRSELPMPASAILNEVQLLLLKHEAPNIGWSLEPTVHDVTRALMEMSGYHRSKGPPGWMTLGRSFEKLLNMELGARVAVKSRLVIND